MRAFSKSAIMQRLQPMQNSHFGSKIKFQKTFQNPFYKSFTVVFCKKSLLKTLNIGEMRAFSKSAIMQRLQPMQNPHFGSKLKFLKTCQNPCYKSFTVVLCKKLLQKNTKDSRDESIFKIGQHAKAIAHAKSSLWVKN